MSIALELPLQTIAELCRSHGAIELSLFGSAARNDFGPDSDYDFLVVFENDDYGPWMGRLTSLQEALSELLGRRVDLVPKDGLKWAIRDEVLRDARVIYEAA